MKVGLHTVDLFPGRERLMPFRTVLEVAKVMKAHGWEADVLNSSVAEQDAQNFDWQGVEVLQCPRDFGELSEWVNARGYDVFFFAATIREGLKNLSGFQDMHCRKIAYVPSGITPKWNAMWMMCKYGVYAKAWMLEAFTPKGLLGKKLRKAGFTDLIGLTDYTARVSGGSLKAHAIYPGKDDFENVVSDDSMVVKNGLKGKKFYLFTGGPAASRGGREILLAFDKFAHRAPDALLVFLVRQDVGGKYAALFQAKDKLEHKNRVLVLQDDLTRAQLKAYFEAAYAVILPFLCIPAEVPLTYYEVMACGTPVVSFDNGGTTRYLRDGLKMAGLVGVSHLAKAMSDLWRHKQERDALAVKALGVMANHPTWEDVGKQWMDVVSNNN